ncbi:sulfatase [Arenicella sp.]|nr:sulfatase [Arenicella sp.]
MKKTLLAILLLPLVALQAAEKPNILMLFADDLGRYASAYADPANPGPNDIISTPTFDRIAKEGVLALNAFVSAPSCSPSRAALVSGRHFFRNGSCSQLHHRWHGKDSADPWNAVEGYGKRLEAAGYHIGLTHKDHVKNNQFGPQFSKGGKKVNQFSQNVSNSKDAAEGKELLYEECRKNFALFLKNRKEGQPFLYSFHPTNPHRKWTKGSGKALWGLDPDKLEGKMPPFLPDVPEVREDLADYMGEGMAFDKCCEALIEEVKKLGELDNTLIVISGDHGAPGFPRGKTNVYDFGARVLFAASWPGKIKPGQVIEQPISLVDVAPTFLAAAGLPAVDTMNGQNLLPALAGGDHDQLRGWALLGREVHVETARDRQLPYPVRSLRTPNYLYVINFKPDRFPMGGPQKLEDENPPSWEEINGNTRLTYADVDAGPTRTWMLQNRDNPEYALQWNLGFGPRPEIELYDLKKDPHQISNVADTTDYRETQEALHAQLMAELEKNGDPRLDGDQFDYPPYCKEGLPKP